MQVLPEDLESDEYQFNDELKCAYLLVNDILFINNAINPETLCLYLNCSDMFIWGATDAENVLTTEIDQIWECIKKYGPVWGGCIWVCFKRNLQPQLAVREKLKELNLWDKDLESLYPNKN